MQVEAGYWQACLVQLGKGVKRVSPNCKVHVMPDPNISFLSCLPIRWHNMLVCGDLPCGGPNFLATSPTQHLSI